MNAPRGPVYITRKAAFCASHRYYREDWSPERNREVFGACSNPWGHGHNYELEVTLSGEIDPETGMVLNLKDVDEVIRERVVAVYDHRYVNEEVPGFRSRIPTTENMALDIRDRLEAAFRERAARLDRLVLRESPELWVECAGSDAPGDGGP